ncbi:MAG: TIGR04222 domain-containing membrane protein, partial [Verrucomicrobiaceae bacterium]
MNTILKQQTAGMLAEIPVLDWRGPEFLIFYAVAFMAAVVWSGRRRSKLLGRFDVPPGQEVTLSDPYEMAFLAGGVPRCAQLAVVRLLDKRALEWKSGKWFSGGRLVARSAPGAGMNDIETAVYQGAAAAGEKGIRVDEVMPLAKLKLLRIEVRLAGLGLRPTPGERAGLGFKAVLPLLGLMALGLVKLGIGLVREKPVIFLIVALVLTFIVAVALAAGIRFLTPGGELTLKKLRESREPDFNTLQPNPETMTTSLALMGPAAMAGYAFLMPDQPGFRRELAQMGGSSGAASSGGSSSGCGGTNGCGTSS